MLKYVFTIKEDVCAANGRTNKVSELLSVLPYYGELVDYDTAISDVKNEYQATIDNLTHQLEVLKDHNLTAEEIKVLNVMRVSATEANKKREAEFEEEKAKLIADKTASDNKVEALKNEFRNYKRRIRSMVGDDEAE